jgi:predicted transcriptional regulator
MVVTGDGSLWGVLTLKQLDECEDMTQLVRDVVSEHGTFASVHLDEPLSLALERMGSSGADLLPVVSRANSRQLLGVVTLQDVLNEYGIAGARA